MINKVLQIISTITHINEDELLEKMNQEQLWDSFTHVEIIINLETTFDLVFTPEEIADMKTIKKILYYIEQKVQGS